MTIVVQGPPCVHHVGTAKAKAPDKHSAPEVKECIVVAVGLCYLRTCNWKSVVQRVRSVAHMMDEALLIASRHDQMIGLLYWDDKPSQ